MLCFTNCRTATSKRLNCCLSHGAGPWIKKQRSDAGWSLSTAQHFNTSTTRATARHFLDLECCFLLRPIRSLRKDFPSLWCTFLVLSHSADTLIIEANAKQCKMMPQVVKVRAWPYASRGLKNAVFTGEWRLADAQSHLGPTVDCWMPPTKSWFCQQGEDRD